MKVIDKVPVDFANWAADEFINYFKNYSCLEDYLRFVKKQVIEDLNQIVVRVEQTCPSFWMRVVLEMIFLIVTFIHKKWILILGLLVIDFIMV